MQTKQAGQLVSVLMQTKQAGQLVSVLMQSKVVSVSVCTHANQVSKVVS